MPNMRFDMTGDNSNFLSKLNQIVKAVESSEKTLANIERAVQSATNRTFQSMASGMNSVDASGRKLVGTIKDIKSEQNGLSVGINDFVKQYTTANLTVQALNKSMETFRDAFGTLVDFEKANSKLAAILQTNKEGIGDLTQAAELLGRKTVYTASNVTELQTELAKLGFAKDEILASEKAILNFAQAVDTTLDRAASTTGAAVRMFGASADEAEHYAAAMAIATTKSALDFETIEQNLATFGPVAAQMGFSIEDTLALFGKLKDAGFNGSTAMTALRNIFTYIADDSSKLSQALGRPIESLEDLQEGLINMKNSGTDVAEAMGMVGKRGGAQLLQLITSAEQAGNSITDLRDKILWGESDFNQMSETMADNVWGATKRVESAWQDVVLRFQESNGLFQSLLDGLAGGLLNVSDNINVVEGAVVGLTTSIIMYKAAAMAMAGANQVMFMTEQANVQGQYAAQIAELETLCAVKEQKINEDIQEAVAQGYLTEEQGAYLATLRAQVAAEAEKIEAQIASKEVMLETAAEEETIAQRQLVLAEQRVAATQAALQSQMAMQVQLGTAAEAQALITAQAELKEAEAIEGGAAVYVESVRTRLAAQQALIASLQEEALATMATATDEEYYNLQQQIAAERALENSIAIELEDAVKEKNAATTMRLSAEEEVHSAQMALSSKTAQINTSSIGSNSLAREYNKAVTARNVAAEKLHTATEARETIANDINTLSEAKNTAAKTLNVGTTQTLTFWEKLKSNATAVATAVQNAYNASLLACPLTWVVAGIGALVGIIYAVSNAETDAEKAQRDFNERLDEFEDRMSKTESEASKLLHVLSDSEESANKQEKAFEDLKDTLPELCELYDRLALSTMSASEARKALNTAMEIHEANAAKRKTESYEELAKIRPAFENPIGLSWIDDEFWSFNGLLEEFKKYIDNDVQANVKVVQKGIELAGYQLSEFNQKSLAEQKEIIGSIVSAWEESGKQSSEYYRIISSKYHTEELQKYKSAVEELISQINSTSVELPLDFDTLTPQQQYDALLKAINEKIKKNKEEMENSDDTNLVLRTEVDQRKIEEAKRAIIALHQSLIENGFNVFRIKAIIEGTPEDRAPQNSGLNLGEKKKKEGKAAVNYSEEEKRLREEYNKKKKAYDKAVKSGTVEEVEEARRQKDKADKDYEDLTKTKASSLGKGRSTRRNKDIGQDIAAKHDLQRLAEQRKKENVERIKLLQAESEAGMKLLKVQEKNEKAEYDALLKLHNDANKADLEAFDDSYAKRVTKLEMQHETEMEALEKQSRDYLNAKRDRAQAEFDAEEEIKAKADKNYVKKQFNRESIKLTEDEQATIDRIRTAYIDKYQKKLRDIAKERREDLNQFLKEYGNVEQKRKGIENQFQADYAKAKKSGDVVKAMELMRKYQKDLQDINFEEIQKKLNWEQVFSDLDKVSIEHLKKLKENLETYLKSGNLKLEDVKTIGGKITDISEKIREKGNVWSQLMPGSSAVGIISNKKQRDEEKKEYERQYKLQEKKLEDANDKIEDIKKKIFEIIKKFDKNGTFKSANDISTENSTDVVGMLEKENASEEQISEISGQFGELAAKENEATTAIEGMSSAMEGMSSSAGEAAETIAIIDTIIHGINDAVQEASNMIKDFQEIGIIEKDSKEARAFSKFAESSDAAAEGWDDLKNGNIVGTLEANVRAWDSLFEVFGTWGGSFGNLYTLQEQIDNLSASNKDLADVMQDLVDELSESSIFEALDGYKQALDNLDTQIAQAHEIQLLTSAQWEMGSHSIAHNFDEKYGVQYWSAAKEAIKKGTGKDVTLMNLQDFLKLSPEEKAAVKKYATSTYTAIKNGIDSVTNGNTGQGLAALLDEEIDNLAEKKEELEEKLKEVLTRTTADSVKDDFKSALADMSSDAETFTDNFYEMMRNAVVQSMMDARFNDLLDDWYDDFAAMMGDGMLTESERDMLQRNYKDIVDDALAWREELMSTIGIDEASQQSASRKAVQGMSQDTAEEIAGRMTAIQIASEEQSMHMEQIAMDVSSFKNTLGEIKEVSLSNINANIAKMFSTLEVIRGYTKSLQSDNEGQGKVVELLNNIDNNTKRI